MSKLTPISQHATFIQLLIQSRQIQITGTCPDCQTSIFVTFYNKGYTVTFSIVYTKLSVLIKILIKGLIPIQ